MRKDRATPYVSHVFRVCLVVRDVFGFDDSRMLITALLHDTIEDTTTDSLTTSKNTSAARSRLGRLPDEEQSTPGNRAARRITWGGWPRYAVGGKGLQAGRHLR